LVGSEGRDWVRMELVVIMAMVVVCGVVVVVVVVVAVIKSEKENIQYLPGMSPWIEEYM
jgi:hypothetical protein